MSDVGGFFLSIFLFVLLLFIGLAIAGFIFWTMLGFDSSEPVDLGSDSE